MTAGSATFSIAGAPTETATLNVAGPIQDTDTATLFMDGPPSVFGTLVIGRDQLASGDASLVVLGDITTGSASGIQNTIPIFVAGTSGSPSSQAFNLVMKSEPFASEVGDATLYLRQDNFIPEVNNNTTIFVSGDVSSIGGSTNNSATLQIENRDEKTQTLTLYIDKDFNSSSNTSLSIKSMASNNNITTAISGTFPGTQATTLMIKPPTSGNLSLFTRGYLE
mgnify:FL=1|tara:strand:- start:504 stop:1172 length:669 start_codon:yes stop_codon:yes gene_type:complete